MYFEEEVLRKMFLPWSDKFKKVNNVSELPREMKEAKSVPAVSKFILDRE